VTSRGQNLNLYLNVFNFSTPVFIWHLWQLEITVFLHRCLIRSVILSRQVRKALSRQAIANKLRLCTRTFSYGIQRILWAIDIFWKFAQNEYTKVNLLCKCRSVLLLSHSLAFSMPTPLLNFLLRFFTPTLFQWTRGIFF
jgi:hypothetical protein